MKLISRDSLTLNIHELIMYTENCNRYSQIVNVFVIFIAIPYIFSVLIATLECIVVFTATAELIQYLLKVLDF